MRRRVLAVGVLACAVLTGWGLVSSDTDWTAPVLVESANVDSVALAREWLPVVSGLQREALSDEAVTLDEYVAALSAGATCMREAGFQASDIRIVPDGIRRDFTVTQRDQSDDEVTAAWAHCRSTDYGAVETVWLAQHKRIGVSREQLMEELHTCLSRAGLAAGFVADPDELGYRLYVSNAPSRQWACLERFLIYIGRNVTHPT